MTTAERKNLRVGLRLPPCVPLPELAAASVQAERLGFDAVWFPDSQLIWRDVWTAVAAVAQATQRVGLGVAVTNVETRHASVTASAIRTVAELAPGRLRTGFGVGNSSLGLIGVPPTPRARLETALETIRGLLDGKELDLGGGTGRLRDAGQPSPLYMAASGPKNLAFAGAHADGVILLSGVSVPLLERSVSLVRAGVRDAGRSPDEVPIVASAFAHVTDDIERDARMLKPLCAQLAIGGAAGALAEEGIFIDPPEHPLGGVYPDLVHAEDWDAAVAAVDSWVSDEAVVRFATAFCLFGSTADIEERLAAVAACGVSEILVQHVGSYDLPLELMHQLSQLLPTGAFA